MHAQPLAIYRYGRTQVRVMRGWIETVLPDGVVVHAVPNSAPEDIARATALGYQGDVWGMTLDHDHMHVRLCHAFGLKESPALRDAANGAPSEIGGAEEDAVMALQKFVNVLRRHGKYSER